MLKENIVTHLDAATIEKRICSIAEQINKDYTNKSLVIIGLMKGCLFFVADLVRKLNLDINIEIIYAVSYEGSSSTGNVEILLDIRSDIHQKHVLVVDDVVDTGLTLNKITKMLLVRKPLSLEAAVLFDKHLCREVEVSVKYVGFKLPTKFYIGFGMDFDGRFRQLPYLGFIENDN